MSYRYAVCFLIDYIISLKQTQLFCAYFIFLPIKGSPSRYYLAFAYFFANFYLGLFMKVLLNEKECTFVTAAHFIYYFLILFLDFDIFFFFSKDFLEKQTFGDPCVFCKETLVSAFIFNFDTIEL